MNQRSNELFKNTAIIGIGRISTQVISFLLIPLYSNLLSTEEFGTFDLYTNAVSLLLPIITLQIELAAYKYIITERNNRNQIKAIFSTTLTFVVTSLTLVILLFVFFQTLYSNNMPWLLPMYVIVAALFLTENNIVRALGNNLHYTIASFIVSITTILLNIISLCIYHMGISGLLVSIIIANFIGSIYLLIKEHLIQYFDISLVSKKILKYLLLYSLPLIPNELSWWIIKGSDKVVVTYFLGVSSNGILAMGMKFANIFQSIINIFIIAWTENVILYYQKGQESFNQLLNRIMLIFGWLAILIIAGVGVVFKFMVSESYQQAYFLIPLYIIAVYIYCIGGILGAVYLAENKTKTVTKSTIVAGGLNLLVDIMLIQWMGIYAAAISSIIGYAGMAIYRAIFLDSNICFKVDTKEILYILIGFGCAVISYIGDFPVKLLASILVIIVCLYANRSILKQISNKITQNRLY